MKKPSNVIRFFESDFYLYEISSKPKKYTVFWYDNALNLLNILKFRSYKKAYEFVQAQIEIDEREYTTHGGLK